MEKWHGTSGGYSNHKCRCDECRLAWNKYCRDRKAKQRKEFVASETDVHGTDRLYQRGCTCKLCKAAHARYSRQIKRGGKSRSGECEICLGVGTVVWDHSHSTGVHRGWLCIPCNHALGLVKDNLDVLKRMEQYL